jgi:hypothetical protein
LLGFQKAKKYMPAIEILLKIQSEGHHQARFVVR